MKLCNLLLHIGHRTQILLLTVLLTCLVYYDINNFNTVVTFSSKLKSEKEKASLPRNHSQYNNDVVEFLGHKDQKEKVEMANKNGQPEDVIQIQHSSQKVVNDAKSNSEGRQEERHVDAIEAIL